MIIDFLREHQLNIMFGLSSISGVIFIFTLFTKFISKDKKRAILIMALSSFILLRADRLAYIYRGNLSTIAYYMVRVCNYLVFAMSLSLIYGFNEYLISFHTENKNIESDEKTKIPKILTINKILLMIGEILLIFSQFTNLYYYFDASNNYHRGQWYALCYIIPLLSLMIQFIIVLIYNKKSKKYIFIPLILFTILPIIATIIQLFYYGISLINISCVGVVVVLYAFTIYDANLLIEEKGKLENELHIARKIQLNECPNIFPAFPDRDEFNLYAFINPAKEVGGDFYDYFMLDNNHLGMVMADVSGKGVPAALNMVKAKLILKGTGLYINDPARVLELLNDGFIDNNKLDMFVTVWFGILEISTGKLKFANAGHEDLIIYKEREGYNIYQTKHDIPIGTISDYKYNNYEIKLEKGNKIFLYTDGVVDAINKNNKHYGVDNLLKTLNKNKDKDVKETIESVNLSLDNYSKGCEQFDDITMLCLELSSLNKENKIMKLSQKFKADVNEIDNVFEYFTDSMAKIVGFDKVKNYYVVIDEIFSNIAKYGYKDIDDGREEYIKINLIMDLKEKRIKIIFEDNGIAFNPLTIMEPNTNKKANEREIGGLGIFIVKKMMDNVSYKYKDNKNILTIEKKY